MPLRFRTPWSHRSVVGADADDPATRPTEAFPPALFDVDHYTATYPDVADSGLDPFRHFVERGRAQGRCPSTGWAQVERAVLLRSTVSDTPMRDIVARFPPARRHLLASAAPWERLREMIHPALYCAQHPEYAWMSVSEVFDHYVSHGVFAGLRPSGLFHPAWYRAQVENSSCRPIRRGVEPFFHWLTVGWHRRIVPTPLFDDDYYRARYPDLVPRNPWLFTHYVTKGVFEPSRQPSAVVPPPRTIGAHAVRSRDPVLLETMVRQASAGVVDLRKSSPLEDAAIQLREKLTRLNGPTMSALVERAAAIEPLVLRPYGPRAVNAPPLRHGYLRLKETAETVRRALPFAHYDAVVLAPHCRMAGSARVTGTLTHALGTIDPDARVLVLTTDLPDFERLDWFHEGVTVFDLSAHAEGLTKDEQLRLLLDVVRGLTPARLINVNSRLGWDLLKEYGKQLARLTEIGTYLFTWDLDARGNKGGYPISYLQDCFGFLSWILIDNRALRDELVERYSLSATLQRKLVVAYTPVPALTTDHSGVLERRRKDDSVLRAFWAGRFDRQKRFDVVVDIARLMPDLEIWVWGKPILGGLGVDFKNLPSNITLQGTYEHFDDLPLGECDFFLYTSEWDGLPTILIDAGARAIATVASHVGGVGDMVSEETGFPVHCPLQADAYVAAIHEMVADPAETTRRARALKARVNQLCSEQAYAEVLASVTAGAVPATWPAPADATLGAR